MSYKKAGIIIVTTMLLLLSKHTTIAQTQTIRMYDKVNLNEYNDIKKRQNDRKNNIFIITSYDLSYDSCQKNPSDKGYGITASNFDLKGHTWESARIIAVDPEVIPMESEVEIFFIEDEYKKYNGTYKAKDVGGAIKGNKIDLFLGDYNQIETHQDVWDFGRTKAFVTIIE
jgi:3D (Asp-Asp-Asp) domain-containing protein